MEAADVSIAFVEIQGLFLGASGLNAAVMKMNADFGGAFRLQAFSGSISVR